ncbi:protein kinase domain-containing protein [Polyangium aurulentum]|uniref:serine/threonine-protein kinase n=1 Tax=Polyangium aurulentum TaxID=2567896 RepID=UPI0010ADD915|nr:serine/threonine-protein kinase [Polyangium aurulentum]UQA54726.1 protein kinase [Polyangium aurulentum]
MRLAPGDTFDRYVVEAPLGQGGMGEVYRASDSKLRRKVALKVLRREDDADSETWSQKVGRMLREARTAAGLNHPGIVAVYDVGEHEGTPYIAMELVDGKSLRHLVRSEAPLAMRLGILLDAAYALSAAHRAGLVHRDVKPENVVVREDGAVKVLDFGIARPADGGASPTAETLEAEFVTHESGGNFAGTPAYMAPEQVKGEEIDARADQFGWGVMAYELLSGRLPFRTDRGAMGLVASILSDAPPPLEEAPPEVWAIVRRTLEKEPANRHASMDEVIAALEALSIEGSAPPPPPSQAAAKPPRKWPLVGLLLVAVAAGAASVGIARSGPRASPRSLARALAATPTPITDLPLPATSSDEARAAYKAGIQAMRDGAWRTGFQSFERATQIDPGIGEAWMRMALVRDDTDHTRAREYYRQAILHRGSMSARDQAMLEGLEPILQRDLRDPVEATRRFLLASARFPGDAELASLSFMYAEIPLEARVAASDRCLALDPKHIDCIQGKALTFMRSGRVQEALAMLDRCIEASPSATDCFLDRMLTYTHLGRCDQAESDARTLLGKEPGLPQAHKTIASTLLARGSDISAVESAVETAAKRFEATGSAREAAQLRVHFAVVTGRFDEAERLLRAHEREAALDPTEAAHAWIVAQRIWIMRETGRLAEAAREAEAFLARRGALLRGGNYFWRDPTVYFWRMKLEGGLMTPAAFEAERAAWLHGWDGATTAEDLVRAWISGYTSGAITAEDARRALAALPEIARGNALPVSEGVRINLAAGLGKVHALAGDPKAALPHLEAAASPCMVLEEPTSHTLNQYRLGVAREAVGDRAGACEAYRVVLDRWGRVKASETARDAARRSKALDCEATSG